MQETSPLKLIAQLCCSIDEPDSKFPATKNISGEQRARQSSSSRSSRSTAADLLSFRPDTQLRPAKQVKATPLTNQCLRRIIPSARRSHRFADIIRRPLSSSSSALDFYFRSVLAARAIAAGVDFRSRASSVDQSRFDPAFSGIACPRPMRLTPGYHAFLPTETGNGMVGVSAFDEPLTAFGQCQPALFSDRHSALPLHLGPSSYAADSVSRDCVDTGATIVTSQEESDNHRQQLLLQCTPSLLACLRSLP